jgi:hypothetical protein
MDIAACAAFVKESSMKFHALYQGTTLVGPHKPKKDPGFSPCALFTFIELCSESFPGFPTSAPASVEL